MKKRLTPGSTIKRLQRLYLLCVLFCVSSLLIAADTAHWQRPAYLVDSFVEIALRNEHPPKPSPVRKWTSPINYYLLHQVADQDLHQRLIRIHMEHLAEITGLAISPAKNRQTANFLIVLTNEGRLENDLLTHFGWRSEQQRQYFSRESVCLATLISNKRSELVRAVTIIPVDRARSRGALVSCVIEELTQAMGLPNDSVNVFPSVFNDLSTDAYLSGLDYLLLKMLYDRRVVTGMDEETVRPILRKIADTYEHDGLIHAAAQIAARGGLSAVNP